MNYHMQVRATEELIVKDEEAVEYLAAKIRGAETLAAVAPSATLSLQLAHWKNIQLLLEHGLEGLRRKKDALEDLQACGFLTSDSAYPAGRETLDPRAPELSTGVEVCIVSRKPRRKAPQPSVRRELRAAQESA